MYRADTIVARATASGSAALAVIRMSGRDAFAIADRILRLDRVHAPRPWCLHRGTALDLATGRPLDDVLAVRMNAPRTYTGEDIVEIHCHGSPLVVEQIVASAVHAGARPAERGEFTRRAVLNGRMDLLQAEAVADLIDARLTTGARLAWEQLQGALSRRLHGLRERLLDVLAHVEADVDFSDDELPVETAGVRIETLDDVNGEITSLLAGFPAARRWREGCRVVFAGRPNVGKSSLVNALLGYGRMIVSPEAGTTRDSVEESVDLGGAAFVLIDTAGVRTAARGPEIEAIARAREHAENADVIVHVLDVSAEVCSDDYEILARANGKPRVVVINKIDLPRILTTASLRDVANGAAAVVEASAVLGTGCDELVAALTELGCASASEAQPAGISRVRHRAALLNAAAASSRAAELLRSAEASEIVAIELRAALHELAGITDPVDNEQVLDRIFSEFCIGK